MIACKTCGNKGCYEFVATTKYGELLSCCVCGTISEIQHNGHPTKNHETMEMRRN